MPPPPPPPPPPMMGGPPPPPPPPGNLPSRPPAQNRGALLSDISKGKALKKTVTNDRSAPIVAKGNSGSAPSPLAGAPAVPGMSRPPGGLAPPVPGGTNRARSNSDQGGREASGASGIEQPPQLGGLFAGGMPKLKKRGGGVDTGANRDSSYTSDPESSSRTSAPKPPTMAAPRPPPTAAPPRPGISNAASTPTFHPSIANLRKAALNPGNRPMSSASMKGPPPPIGKKPPAPPPGLRKFSSQAAPPPPPSSMAPPPPPTSAPPLPGAPPPAAPRLPPPSRSQAPPPPPPTSPPSTNGGGQSLAMQAAKRAAGQASPAAAPPPPPPPSNGPSFRAPSPPSAAPPPPIGRVGSQQTPRSMYDPSSYTLSSNGSLPKNPSPSRDAEVMRRVVINDPRWKFQDEGILPKPRDFIGGAKKYRAGRGSSVPLDLAAFQ